ncbi:MAG: DUF4922 domain-containing protein [Ignavibacteriales bacterium]|nr:DUF4922 domain-containing protein [Ignavibacteriales bacterium]
MIDKVLIPDSDLKPWLTGDDLGSKTKALLAHQKENWQLCANGYKSLDSVEVRSFEFDGFIIKVQFNPGRIISSSAKVDEKSIKERKCFLCFNNLPPEQRGILYRNNYLILCNPYPIFNEHFTLPNIEHLPQAIDDSFAELLSFSKELGKYYTVFYNGPKCGASAPDHLHFQAGNKFFMPIDKEYESIKSKLGNKIIEEENLAVYAVDKYLRRFISLESSSKEILVKAFETFYNIYEKISAPGEEPMMNILSTYESEKWKVIIFPRAKHRPSYYFAEGDENILLSPAGVDLGGTLITPLEKDFKKITKDQVIDIFRQVTVTTEFFEFIKKSLKAEITSTTSESVK